MRILGVDPGSRLTGYGCIDCEGGSISLVAHGTLKLANTHGRATIPLENRLLGIYEGLSKVIQEYQPQILSVEKVFFAKNAVSALKLGQARGAVLLTGMIHSLRVVEYSATEVKHVLVGHGRAEKEQVARMLQLMMGSLQFTTTDASDGLALAVCHALSLKNQGLVTHHANAKILVSKRKKQSLSESVVHVVSAKISGKVKSL